MGKEGDGSLMSQVGINGNCSLMGKMGENEGRFSNVPDKH